MNIAAYCRVSTEKEDQLNSLEAQKKFFAEYTARTGDKLVKLYADEGISGTKIKNRRQFLEMMQDAESGLFQAVVVKDISRFARNTVDLLQNIRKLKALGIETQFLTANMTSMGDSEFVLTIFGALAQEESANTSKRVKFGKKINAEKGKVPNAVFGYDKVKGDYFNLLVNGGEAEIVRRIFRLYTEEGFGATAIAGILNGENVKTKRDCKWSANAICRILTNEIYLGKIINGKEEVADFLTGRRERKKESEWLVAFRPELKIIDEEIFYTAERIMTARGKKFKLNKKRHSNRHLFSTLIRCKECSWSYKRVSRTYKNTYVRWVCSGRNGRGADTCGNLSVAHEGELMQILADYFASAITCKNKITESIAKNIRREYERRNGDGESEKKLGAEIAKLKKNRQKFIEMYTDDAISIEELKDKTRDLKKRIEELEKKSNAVSFRKTYLADAESIINETFKGKEELFDLSQMTNAGLKKLIKAIEIDKNGNVDIYINKL